jgi:CubicO group peptidase (beta-lactamase class C family)
MDVGLIAALFERINDQSYKNIHSVLLVKNGKLVVEEYFPGRDSNGKERAFDRDMRHEMHSVAKSVNSILVGIAIDQHLVHGVDEKISELLPEYADVFADHRRDELRLKHLLTMSAGLSWDEWTHPYSDLRNDLAALDRSKDLVKYVLERPVIAPPGVRFDYSGGISVVLGEIVHRRSNLATGEFARRFQFDPLGI